MPSAFTKPVRAFALKHKLNIVADETVDGRVFYLRDANGRVISMGGRTYTSTPGAFLAALRAYVITQES